MGKGVKHYTKDGKEHKGGTHIMPDGSMHSGATHTKNSQKLFHYGALSAQAKAKAREGWKQ